MRRGQPEGILQMRTREREVQEWREKRRIETESRMKKRKDAMPPPAIIDIVRNVAMSQNRENENMHCGTAAAISQGNKCRTGQDGNQKAHDLHFGHIRKSKEEPKKSQDVRTSIAQTYQSRLIDLCTRDFSFLVKCFFSSPSSADRRGGRVKF